MMPAKRVDFYILNTADELESLEFTCRLIEKIYLRNHRLFAYCDGLEQAHQLDELLWTFKANSFIPHNLENEGPMPPPPIQIGVAPPSRFFKDVLLNLSHQLTEFHERFGRIIEILDERDDIKRMGRETYRAYQSYGYSLHVHKIDAHQIKESYHELA